MVSCNYYKYWGIVLSAMMFFLPSAQGKREMPVIGYIGVPARQTTMERFREMRECGFNVSLNTYYSVKDAQKALDIAQKNDMKLILRCNEVEKDYRRHLSSIISHPAFLSYFIGDEPTRKQIPEFADKLSRIRSVDKNVPCYINLAPSYDFSILSWLGFNTYASYLKEASAAFGLSQISFDYYPLVVDKKGRLEIRETWYSCLEDVRAESLRTAVPFWAFVLSTPHIVYPQPTLAHLRLQVYSNLLYGAQGIQYFTYWTPPQEKEYDYHNGPIGRSGERTQTYNVVKAMNAELAAVAPLFLEGRIIRVGHLGTFPSGAHKFGRMPSILKGLKLKSDEGALCAELERGKERYLLIQNKGMFSNLQVSGLPTSNTTLCYVDKQLVKSSLKSHYTLIPGDILIIKF